MKIIFEERCHFIAHMFSDNEEPVATFLVLPYCMYMT